MKPSSSASRLSLACFASVIVLSATIGQSLRAQTVPAPPATASSGQQAAPPQTPPSGTPQTEPSQPEAAPPAAEEQDKPVEARDKNAPVTVRGCLDGVMLVRVEAVEEIARLTPTLRLLAKKDVKKQLKGMSGYEVEVTGLLKLPPKSPLSRKIGNTTVSVGLGNPRSPQNQPMYQQQIDYGTLDVTQARNLATRCSGRP